MNWQPIETAPKDGSSILLWGTWAGEIHGIAKHPCVDIGRWDGGNSDFPGEEWWTLDTGDCYTCWMKPTHWAPIPVPPKE